MTKRDFEAIARVISNLPTDGSRVYAANELADIFTERYPAFRRDTWFNACRSWPRWR